MLILVTGGAGFVGTNLIKQLLKKGHRIISIDDYSTGKKENHIDHENVQYIKRDLLDIDPNDFLWKPALVYHLAAKARIQPSFEQPEEYIRVNYEGTYNIIKLCLKQNISLIYAGSSSHHSGKFKNPYTFSKDMGEDIIKLYRKHFNLRASIVRFYNVYGPHQLTEGGYTTLIGRWINNIENNIPCEIYGDGEKRRDFTHVDDITRGLIKILEKGTYKDDFEFGRGKNLSVNEVAKMFDITPIYKNEKPGEAQNTLCDNSIAKKLLSWRPIINLEDYIYKQKELWKNTSTEEN
jgi:UDP-glucose 4-epimerase